MWEIAEEVRIERPVDEVRAQFADVAHHEATAPHRGTTFRVISEDPATCEYEQRTRLGPMWTRQRFVLDRSDPGHQVNRIVAGPFRGGSITFDVTGDDRSSHVVATVRHDPSAASRPFGLLVRRVLRRSLAGALEEDCRDLESGNYPAA